MNILTVDNITKAYGERKLFDSASFFLQEGEKAGIIGINGTGKSTLLKIIAGLEEPDEGKIIRAAHTVVSFLPQHPVFDPEDTVLEAVLKQKKSKKGQSDNGTAGSSEAFGMAGNGEAFGAAGFNMENEAKSMMTKLGIFDFTEKCGYLSGGQKKRLALIRALLAPADILILDEPTNHLDGQMADWLEETLRKRKGAVIMVTHDRYFLDSVAGRIVEIDKGHIYSYETNYSGYLELKMQREEMEQASERKRQSILRTELEWVKRGARARSTKQKARLERYEELKNRTGPLLDQNVELGSVSSRLGRTTIELSHITKAYGEKLLIQDFSYIFLKNDRVGFVGRNGCGKTTLMKMINGQCEPDAGELTVGQTVKIGYYAQECEMLTDKRVIDYIRDVAEIVETPEGKITASRMLERFLFSGEDQYGPIGKLSGGEKRRLNLCRVLMDAPNVLILDEPTNDLDIATLTILESYLDTFQGIVIAVSHDRYFLDRTMRRIFAFEGEGKINQYEGGYSDYILRKTMEEQLVSTEMSRNASGNAADKGKTQTDVSSNADNAVKTGKQQAPRKLRFSYKEQKEYETIEADIAALEEKIEALEAEIPRFSSDFIKLQELTEKKQALEKELEEKMDRWMYLEELAARIEAGELQ
ncbi:MAG: ABC-F family ATP-binding cassette domain-containing protein [Lachnospiraceae bacterium]|nr:ABC-F family ATP-binding cassette domain-containing protein [Lachnospiraceae bacterium]